MSFGGKSAHCVPSYMKKSKLNIHTMIVDIGINRFSSQSWHMTKL